MMSRPAAPRRVEAGFVIIAVLWLLAALATFAAVYAVYTSNIVVASRVLDDRHQSEASIKAGLELTAYQLGSKPRSPRAPRMGRSRFGSAIPT